MPALLRRYTWLILVASLLLGSFPAFSQQPADNNTAPSGHVTAAGPAGLFLISRYWVATRSLERAAWYFAPDGQVYARLETGLSPEALAAHKGRKGRYTVDAGQFAIVWADGKVNKRDLKPGKAGDSFEWDGAIFVAPPPLDPKLIIGTFGTGLTMAGKGMGTLVSNSLTFRADGTYVRSGAPLVKGGHTPPGVVPGPAGGTWKYGPYVLALTGNDGHVTQQLAFPCFEEAKDAPPSLFLGGQIMKRQ